MKDRITKLKKRRAEKKKAAKKERRIESRLLALQDTFVKPNNTPAEPIARRPDDVLQVKIECLNTPYPAWRRVLLPGGISLDDFVHALIAAMGWDDEHKSSITIGKTLYLASGFGIFSSADILHINPNERDAWQYIAIDELKKSKKITMLYDYGDSWEHKITIEKILSEASVQKDALFTCLDGAGACPPEDCGGSDGIYRIVYLMENSDKNEDAYDKLMDWLGERFDKDKFSKDEVNRRLRRFA